MPYAGRWRRAKFINKHWIIIISCNSRHFKFHSRFLLILMRREEITFFHCDSRIRNWCAARDGGSKSESDVWWLIEIANGFCSHGAQSINIIFLFSSAISLTLSWAIFYFYYCRQYWCTCSEIMETSWTLASMWFGCCWLSSVCHRPIFMRRWVSSVSCSMKWRFYGCAVPPSQCSIRRNTFRDAWMEIGTCVQSLTPVNVITFLFCFLFAENCSAQYWPHARSYAPHWQCGIRLRMRSQWCRW